MVRRFGEATFSGTGAPPAGAFEQGDAIKWRHARETQSVREYSRRLEEKSRELEAAASQLSEANQRLTLLDAEKDDFLSHVSHEVRTPMTSIRSSPVADAMRRSICCTFREGSVPVSSASNVR